MMYRLQRLLVPVTALCLASACAHTAVQPVSPAEDANPLRVDGAPPVPSDLKARMQPYLEARSAALRDISDDASTLLVSTRFGSTTQLHLVTRPLGARRQVTFGAESVQGAAFVPGRSDAFVFMRDIGGNEKYQLWLTDLARGETRLLTDGVSRHGAFTFTPDGATIHFTSNARNGRDMDIWSLSLASPEGRSLVFERSGHWSPIAVSPNGKHLLLHHFESIERSSLHLAELAGGAVRPLTGDMAAASIRAAAFIEDGAGWLALTDHDSDLVGVWRGAMKDGAPTWSRIPTDLPWNVEQLAVSGDMKTAALGVNAGGLSEVYLLDIATGKLSPGPAGEALIIQGLSFAKSAPVLGLTVAGPARSGDAGTWRAGDAKITLWTESEAGGLRLDDLIIPSFIRWTSFDGLEIPGYIYRPKGAGPHPVVVWIHGGPESQSRPYFHALAQYLARESGIAVVFPNVRGSDGYGRRWLGLDNGRLREDSVKDIGALLDWVAADAALDGERVAVVGGSYGGYMVLASLVHFGNRLKAGIDVVGISDFVTFLENTADYRRHLRRAEYGDESDPEMRAFLKSISPLSQAAKIRSALFVAHGANDPRVPLSEALQITDAVRRSGREVWTMVAMNEGHGFSKRENRDMWAWLSALFLETQLRPR